MLPVALTIAGSDPSGGAGIQADLKTFHRFGVYGTAVLTLVTVQNTQGVSRVEVFPGDLVREQIDAVTSDFEVKVAKTGALGSREVIEAVMAWRQAIHGPTLVVDPVMISKHGAALLDESAVLSMRQLLPSATLVTPNLPEAEVLSGVTIRTPGDMMAAARHIRASGCQAVLVKGGHSEGEPHDFLSSGEGERWFKGDRIRTRHTHGTGCTLSAAITAGLASGQTLHDAIERAKDFLQRAIETAPGLGRGHGPVNHFA